jgi:two-component sensor histidine kinase
MLNASSDPLAESALFESNHRIANHLSLIAAMLLSQKKILANAAEFSRGDAIRLLEDCGHRIETVARVHRLLACPATPHGWIDIRDYLRDLAQCIIDGTAMRGRQALVTESGEVCYARADHLASLGLLVGELVTNAVKYSHPSGVSGIITLSLSSDAACSPIVAVSDDGVGLPEGLDPLTCRTGGLQLIRSLSTRLRATLSFDNTGLGLRVTIRVPRLSVLQKATSLAEGAS